MVVSEEVLSGDPTYKEKNVIKKGLAKNSLTNLKIKVSGLFTAMHFFSVYMFKSIISSLRPTPKLSMLV